MGGGVDDDIGGDAKNRAVAKRGASGKAGEDIDRHRQNTEDQHFGGESDLIIRQYQWQGGGSDNDDGSNQRSATSHAGKMRGLRCERHRHAARPNRPSGRNASNTAIGPKMTK